jgi:DNA polymerase V
MHFVTLANSSKIKTDFVSSTIKAGFPSPAEDYIDRKIDLNEQLIANPAATFMVRVEGSSMIDCGINEQDVLIVDKSLKAKDKDIILAVVDGEFTVKRLRIKRGVYELVPENPEYQVITITEGTDFVVWGVVTYVIHQAK